jgi:predicted HTH transcriptional regulator
MGIAEMNNTSFERLLHEEETTLLDFKQQQYPFAHATDEQKSELLKDILGMANAWRRVESFILIGVEDVRGGRANVIGIPVADHLSDHSVQQFVNNLTNRPVLFHYEAFPFEGNQVGIIQIEERQARPLYLKHDYGKLKKGEVYVRRGSSTDPTKPAAPDEIALMGTLPNEPSPTLGEVKASFHALTVEAHMLNDQNNGIDKEIWADNVRAQIEHALIGAKLHLFKRDFPRTFQGVRQWLFADSQNLTEQHINPNFRFPKAP